jgi:ribonuclease Z
VQGVDLLVHDSTYTTADVGLAIRHAHTTAAEAGRIAAEAGARALVLTHISSRYRAAEIAAMADEAMARFPGEVVVAEDGLYVEVQTGGAGPDKSS